MSLLEEWESGTLSWGTSAAGTASAAPQTGSEASQPARQTTDFFSLSTIERQISRYQASEAAPAYPCNMPLLLSHNWSAYRGRGQITAIAAANDTVVVGTSRGFLIRYDIAQSTAPGTADPQ